MAASVVVEMSGDEAKLFRSLVKVQQAQDQYNDKLRRTKNEGQSAGKTLADSFGSRVVGQVKNLVLGFASLQTGISLVTGVLRKAREESDAAIASMRQLVDVERSLAQIATDEQDLRAMRERADFLAERFGIDRQEARQLLFAARSEGFEGAVGFIAKNAPVVSPESAAIVAGQIPALFKGRISPQEAINATLVAAEQSRLNFEQLARAAPGAAEGAAVAGASPAETFALLSVLASRFKSGDTAADRIKAFGVKVGIDDRFKGKGILESFRVLRDEFTAGERADFLGSSNELNTVFAVLSDEFETVRERQKLIEDAIRTAESPDSRIEIKRRAAEENFGQLFQLRGAEIGKEVAREQAQKNAVAVQEAAEDIGADLRRAGVTPFQLFRAETGVAIERFFRGDEDLTPERIREIAIGNAAPFFRGNSDVATRVEEARRQREAEQAAGAMREAAIELKGAAKNLNDASQRQPKRAQQQAEFRGVATE